MTWLSLDESADGIFGLRAAFERDDSQFYWVRVRPRQLFRYSRAVQFSVLLDGLVNT